MSSDAAQGSKTGFEVSKTLQMARRGCVCAYVSKCSAAHRAFMRLFAGVGAFMNRSSAGLNELLGAESAQVGPRVRMGMIMAPEVRVSIEALTQFDD